MNDRQDMTITEFCDVHGACGDGREWAVQNCKTMQDVWRDAKPEWLIWVATREGVLADKTLRLFGCWCVRQQAWHLAMDQRSRDAVEVAERYANGEATQAELYAAWSAAWAAVWDAAWGAARAAAWDAARAAAWDAAWAAAAWAAAWSAVLARAAAARGAEARAAAWDAARADQAEWLRQHATPSFRKEAI